MRTSISIAQIVVLESLLHRLETVLVVPVPNAALGEIDVEHLLAVLLIALPIRSGDATSAVMDIAADSTDVDALTDPLDSVAVQAGLCPVAVLLEGHFAGLVARGLVPGAAAIADDVGWQGVGGGIARHAVDLEEPAVEVLVLGDSQCYATGISGWGG